LDLQIGKSSWTTQKKKRRRDREDEAGGPKLRKLSSSVDEKTPTTEMAKAEVAKTAGVLGQQQTTISPTPTMKTANDIPKVATIGLGLGDYDSDEDD